VSFPRKRESSAVADWMPACAGITLQQRVWARRVTATTAHRE
jgi:hypothetical protein